MVMVKNVERLKLIMFICKHLEDIEEFGSVGIDMKCLTIDELIEIESHLYKVVGLFKKGILENGN